MGHPSDLHDIGNSWPISRRRMVQVGATLATAPVAGLARSQQPAPVALAAPLAVSGNAEPAPVMMKVQLQVNGKSHMLTLDTRTTVLDALRQHLGMKGSKKGCDHGQCGACTVLIGGRRTNSCLTLAVMHDGQQITTIEGLSSGEQLHPMQDAFLKHDGFQCGYRTPRADLFVGRHAGGGAHGHAQPRDARPVGTHHDTDR